MTSPVDLFHPLIRKWFGERFGAPTDIQVRAWPQVAQQRHVLITAPTGSGKTLTAFLWAIDRLVSGQWPLGSTRVLYVSPLKALNNDIRCNLEKPLEELRALFESMGQFFPNIRVLTRSGDTPQSDRRKMVRKPPEILITTPESLNLMLSSVSGRALLVHLSTVILDEIHALVGSKRGTHLITAVDRLVRLSGEFQRIAISATVKDLDVVSAFVGGFQMKGSSAVPHYQPRKVASVQSDRRKSYRIKVRYLKKTADTQKEGSVWPLLADEFRQIADRNRATLFFTNGRRLCEKLSYQINRRCGQPMAYAHHGSLSKQLRQDVEQRLKKGDLRAIVATSSLEMGIDIGDLDEVVLVQPPPSISAAVQRIGRAGHQVGKASRGTLFPAHPRELIRSAVLAKAVAAQDIEPLKPIQCPLDVLAQILVSMTAEKTWDTDELLAWLRTSYPFRHLSRQQYDLVLNMLVGKYADTRIRELKPRISIDRLDNTVAAKKGALLALYMSGGTIPDRGYYQLRHQKTNARIGELDEEYVWEARIGQVATFGTQNWKIDRITHNDVYALPVGNKGMDAPFWRAESLNRDFHFSQRISDFIAQANGRLQTKKGRKAFLEELENDHHMERHAGERLIHFLRQQQMATGVDLPHHDHLVLEYVRSGPDGHSGSQLVIHTFWGGRLNRPYALALEAAWADRLQERPQVFAGNDAIAIQMPRKIPAEEVLACVTAGSLESCLRSQLERSGFFGARFRECAGRALLITRGKINQRMPLWMTRLRAQKLMENVRAYADFPILLEAWRCCLQDEFDMPRLMEMMARLDAGRIAWSVAQTARPSPFAAQMAWNQINQYMYQEDQPASERSRLGKNLIRDVALSPNLRPVLARSVVHSFENKRQRLAKGYAPQTLRDLVDWVKERVAIPLPQWQALLAAMVNDHGVEWEKMAAPAGEKLVLIAPEGTKVPLVVAIENVSDIRAAWYPQGPAPIFTNLENRRLSAAELAEMGVSSDHRVPGEKGLSLISLWLQFYGPQPADFARRSLGLARDLWVAMRNDLLAAQTWISGQLVEDGPENDICDAENYETLLRMTRNRAVPAFEPLEIEHLPLFLAGHQQVAAPSEQVDGLYDCLEQLVCLPLSAELWESEILPARMRPYHTAFLDTVMQEGALRWLGFDKRKAAFYFESDLDLLSVQEGRAKPAADPDGDLPKEQKHSKMNDIFADHNARYDFAGLLSRTGYDSARLSDEIWTAVWQGALSNETYLALRKGLATKFKPPAKPMADGRQRSGRRGFRPGGRSGFARWRGSLPFSGHWYRPAVAPSPGDEMEVAEIGKDRARILLDRYGIVFQALLQKELPAFKWTSVFRSLRLMELSGEILGGYFFKGIVGPQFISRQAFRKLSVQMPAGTIFWMNAADPASLCGVPIEGLKQALPKRLSTTHVVFKGVDVVVVCERNGRSLSIRCAPDDPDLVRYMAPLQHLLHRSFAPLKSIAIETINAEAAARSPYAGAFATVFDTLQDVTQLVLYPKID